MHTHISGSDGVGLILGIGYKWRPLLQVPEVRVGPAFVIEFVAPDELPFLRRPVPVPYDQAVQYRPVC